MSGRLSGCRVLVVEDEPLIALDVAETLRGAGAVAIIAHKLSEALRHAESMELDAAVLDHSFPEGDITPVSERLVELGVPFVIHSGFHLPDEIKQGMFLAKPASPERLVDMVAMLAHGRD